MIGIVVCRLTYFIPCRSCARHGCSQNSILNSVKAFRLFVALIRSHP